MSFKPILDRAIALRGEEELYASLPSPKSKKYLTAQSDAAYLSEMAKCIFRSGFVWQIVENKWDNFERAFAGFNPKAVAHFSDEKLEELATDTSIIRNQAKITATRENAKFVLEVMDTVGSFGKYIANWPESDLVGLLLELKKRGSRLGGHTGMYFLRFVGKDSFIFSKDVVQVLVNEGVVDKEPTSKSGLKAVQEQFNAWHSETGLPYTHLSRIMAQSIEG